MYDVLRTTPIRALARLALATALTLTGTHVLAQEVPEPVRLFEVAKHDPVFRAAFPHGEVMAGHAGIALSGVDVCALLAESASAFYVLPKHLGTPDHAWDDPVTGSRFWFQTATNRAICAPFLTEGKVIIAYGGWCTAGVEDPKDGAHFSPSFLPYVARVVYGETVVLYFNHYAKSHVPRDDAGEGEALRWVRDWRRGQPFDIREPGTDLLPAGLARLMPPKRRVPLQ